MFRVRVAILAGCMLFTGTINTIATKYQDIIVVGYTDKGDPILFRHPAVQSACMFLGEALCLVPYFAMRWYRRRAKRRDPGYLPMPAEEKMERRWRRILAFAVPTLCDATGTSLMNVGLFYTYASIYQMLRGTLVLFAGMFTILILRRQLYIHHWLGMVLITAGAALVGASSVIYAAQDAAAATTGGGGGGEGPARALLRWVEASGLAGVLRGSSGGGAGGAGAGAGGDGAAPSSSGAPLLGDLLVVGAQMFTALQFILEEKFLVKYKVPALLAVGLEGCWGLLLCAVALPVLSVVRAPDGLPIDDAPGALRQLAGNQQLVGAVGVSVLSIAAFNFTGISVTKSLSGGARAAIDACRTIFIWMYCLHAGWERFHMLQVVGFVVLIAGSSLYNELLKAYLPGGDSSHRHRRRRARRAGPPGDASDGDTTEPLLPGTAAAAPSATGDGGGNGGVPHSAPVPLAAPAPAHARPMGRGGRVSITLPEPSLGSTNDMYIMARSMRLGVSTLSPHSLDSGVLDMGASSFMSGTPYLSASGSQAMLPSEPSQLTLMGGDESTASRLRHADSYSSTSSLAAAGPRDSTGGGGGGGGAPPR